MNVGLVCLAVTALAALAVSVGSRTRRAELEQWSIGGRRFGSALVFLLLAGEIYTTFALLGGSGLAYSNGGAALYVLAYTPLAYAVSYWLLPVIWRYAKATGAISQSDFFTRKYASPALGVIVTLVGVTAMIPYLSLQLRGMSIIASQTSYGGISRTPAVLLGGLLLAVYVVVGGMRGAALNAMVKDVLILVVVLALVLYLPQHYFGSVHDMFRAVEARDPGHATLREHTGTGESWFVSTVLITAVGFFMWPHLFTSSFTARDEGVFRRNAMLLPMYNLVLLLAVIVGFTAFAQRPGLPRSAQDLALLDLAKDGLPPWAVGLVGAAGLLTGLVPGAVLATTTGSLLARNVYRPLRPDTGERQLTTVARVAVILVIGIATLMVFHGGTTLTNLLLVGYTYIVQLLPALLGSLAPRNPLEKWGAGAGMLTGLAIGSAFSFGGVTSAYLAQWLPVAVAQLNSGVFALAGNLVVAFTVSALVRRAAGRRALAGQDLAVTAPS